MHQPLAWASGGYTLKNQKFKTGLGDGLVSFFIGCGLQSVYAPHQFQKTDP